MTIPQIPSGRSLGSNDSWVALPSGGPLPDHPVRIGLTTAAASSISGEPDLTLPAVRTRVTAGTICGYVGTPGVPVHAPVSGIVTVHNEDLAHNPTLAVTDPTGSGWLFAVMADSSTDTGALHPLLTAGASST